MNWRRVDVDSFVGSGRASMRPTVGPAHEPPLSRG